MNSNASYLLSVSSWGVNSGDSGMYSLLSPVASLNTQSVDSQPSYEAYLCSAECV